MYNTAIINRRTPINLSEVAVIEPLTAKDVEGLVARYGGEAEDFSAFNSAVRLIGGSTKLAVQTLDDFIKLTKGRVLNVGAGAEGGAPAAGPLVPIAAIRHLEPVSDKERAAMKAAYGDADPEAIDVKRTRIVYRALDPANPQRYFQKTFEADILDDLMDRDSGFLIDIGNGKYVLADEIEDARLLGEAELKRLSRKYALKARGGGPLITSIVLRGGELILSSIAAVTIGEMVGRPMPSASGSASASTEPPDEPARKTARAKPDAKTDRPEPTA